MKKYDLLGILSFFAAAGGYIVPNLLRNLDEVWNFSFALNCARGLWPYRDFNMVQTPLAPMAAAVVLRLLGQELWVFRICGVLLCGGILTAAYEICRFFQMRRGKAYLYCMVLALLLGKYFTYDYNFLNLLIILLMIWCELKAEKEGKERYSWMIGLLCGLSCLVKQTTGMMIHLAAFGVICLCRRDGKGRLLGIRAAMSGIVLAMFVGVCWWKGSLESFWEYCVIGVGGFCNRTTVLDYMKGGIFPTVFLAVSLGYLGYWVIGRPFFYKRKESREKLPQWRIIFLLYGLASCSLVFPIFDEIHFAIGIFPVLLMMIVDLDRVTSLRGRKDMALGVVLAWGMTLLLIGGRMVGTEWRPCMLNHFHKIPIETKLEEQILEVDEALLRQMESGEDVYLLDASASAYLIPLDLYHKDYDFMLYGNLGKKQPEALVRDLEGKNVSVYILGETHSTNWQFPDEVRELVRKEWTYKETTVIFDRYEAGE